MVFANWFAMVFANWFATGSRLCSRPGSRLCSSTAVCEVRHNALANCSRLTTYEELASLRKLFFEAYRTYATACITPVTLSHLQMLYIQVSLKIIENNFVEIFIQLITRNKQVSCIGLLNYIIRCGVAYIKSHTVAKRQEQYQKQ